MFKTLAFCLVASIIALPSMADEAPRPEVKTLSGISILGNQEAPKSLVIVPWKSSEIGKGVGLSNSSNDRPVPVDREVFARQLSYYSIRSSGNGR